MGTSLISPEELLETLGAHTVLDVRWQLDRAEVASSMRPGTSRARRTSNSR